MIRNYDLKLGYSCNNDCIHCVIQDSKRRVLEEQRPIDITTDEAISLISEQLKDGLDSITITGGEVSLRDDLPRIVDYCLDHSLAVSIQTNGRLLSSTKLQRVLLEKPVCFVIALHGTTGTTHDAITRRKGSFEETLKGIRAAVSHSRKVILKTVISKINMMELPDFIPFMERERLSIVNMAFPHAQGAARENFGMVVPRYKDLRTSLVETARRAILANIDLSFETVPPCILPEYPEFMSELFYAFKEVSCTQVGEDTFDWNVIRKTIKTKPESCGTCFFDNYCEGPWSEYVDHFGANEFRPVKVSEE